MTTSEGGERERERERGGLFGRGFRYQTPRRGRCKFFRIYFTFSSRSTAYGCYVCLRVVLSSSRFSTGFSYSGKTSPLSLLARAFALASRRSISRIPAAASTAFFLYLGISVS